MKISRIVTNKSHVIVPAENQYFSETLKRVELWEEIKTGYRYKVKGWNKKSLLWIFLEDKVDEEASHELDN